MLTKPDKEATNCLIRLQGAEFAPLLRFLQQENGQVLGALMSISDDTTLRQFQGRAQFANDLLTLVANAKHPD